MFQTAVLILAILNLTFGNTKYVTYETNQGNVRGVERQARNGRYFDAFFGVPYARPPIGPYRWQPPQPAPRWEGILDATKNASICVQDDLYNPKKLKGSEDCLYINVFTSGKGMIYFELFNYFFTNDRLKSQPIIDFFLL